MVSVRKPSEKYTISEKIIYFLISLWAILSLYSWANNICLYVFLPLSFVLVLSQNRDIYETNRFLKLLFVLYFWFLISSFFSVDVNESFLQVKRTVATFLLCTVFASIGEKRPVVGYVIYLLFFIALLYYAYFNILSIIDVSEERMQDDNVNANMFAYYTSFTTFALFILSYCSTNKKRLFNVLFLGMIPLSFIVALLTGSRQTLLVQIPLIASLLGVKYVRNGKGVLVFSLIILVAILLFFSFGEGMYEHSTLAHRNELSVGDDERTFLIKDAFRVGFNNIVLGVGPGCYKLVNPTHHYAHCAYAELIACSGLPALAIYVSMLIIFIKTQIKRYYASKNRLFLSFALFGVIFSFQNLFYAFYLLPWLMSFFVLVSSHSNSIFKKLKFRK